MTEATNIGVLTMKEKTEWMLFQVNKEHTEGYTLFFDTYEHALNAVNTEEYYEIEERHWLDYAD